MRGAWRADHAHVQASRPTALPPRAPGLAGDWDLENHALTQQVRPNVPGAEGAKAGMLVSDISSADAEAHAAGVRDGLETLDAFLQRPLDEFVPEAAGPDAGEKGAAILSEKQAEHLVRGIDPDERDEKCSVISQSALPDMCMRLHEYIHTYVHTHMYTCIHAYIARYFPRGSGLPGPGGSGCPIWKIAGVHRGRNRRR